MQSQLVFFLFVFFTPLGIRKLSRVRESIFHCTLARMLLAIDKWAVNTFAWRWSLWKGDLVLLKKEVTFCSDAEVFPHAPPPGSLPPLSLLCLLVTVSFIFRALLFTTSHERVCSASPLPPLTHLCTSHIVAYGFDVRPWVNDTLCGASEWSHCWTARSSKPVISA